MPYTSLTTPSPVGWNNWIYVKDFYQDIIFPDASFPSVYLPSSTAWISQILSNCLFPWINTYDPLSAFLIGGGASGTLLGSVSGLNVVDTLNTIPQQAIFGIGRYPPGGAGPQIGYCIGDLFKQNVYCRMAVFSETGVGVVVTNTIVELLQNSKYKRAYVNHGEIVNYEKIDDKHVLTLDFTSTNIPPNSNDIIGETITITKKSPTPTSSVFTVNIDEILSNWKVVISDPGDGKVPQSGDFYQLNTTWCIEDPYLLSGFWKGQENSNYPSSGLGLYSTTHNSPYSEGQFLGVYIWKPSSTLTTTTTTAISQNGTVIEEIVDQPHYGYTMADVGGNTWSFFGFGINKSSIYPSDIRYKENVLQIPDSDGNVTVFLERDISSKDYYRKFISDPRTEYIRVEISTGGNSYRNNWHAPCLRGSYVKSNGSLFKILGQVDSNTIDVSLKSIDSSEIFDPYSNINYSIINQSAWFINEHYDGDIDFSHKGIFNGIIYGSGRSYVIKVNGDSYPDWVKFNGLSFIDRYRNTIALSGNLKERYDKFQNWMVVRSDGDKEYPINRLTFIGSPSDFAMPYEIKLELKSDATDLSGEVSICFDSGFDTIGNISRTAYSYVVEATPYVDSGSGGFILSDKLCLNGEYLSVPYEIDIPTNTRIGFCGDLYFGLSIDGKACPLTLVSTKRSARGVASLFHALRQEDWIAYIDPTTEKITIRRGSLNFKEYPMKTEVAIGKPSLIETPTQNGKQISLNTSKKRSRRIQMDVPDISDTGIYASPNTPPGTTVTNGNYIFVTVNGDTTGNTYGFLISGLGKVDLVALERMGMQDGNVNSNAWTYDDTNVSPVYIYKKSDFQNLKKMSIDVGLETAKNRFIYIQGGTVSNLKIQYSDDNQTVEENGLFDIVRLADGENLVLYSVVSDQFDVGGQLNNSISNSTRWTNRNSVMAIGSFNDSFYWGSPLKKGFNNPNDVYPIMLLNSVDYLGCIYNKNNNTLAIFVRSYKNKKPYVGCFVISVLSIASSPNHLCSHPDYNSLDPDSVPLNFLWRPPTISYSTDPDKSWTDSDNLIKYYSTTATDSTSNVNQTEFPNDDFIRVMGPSGFNCQFDNSKEIGITSATMLDDGTYVFFYDSDAGVKAVFSDNCGISWAGNNNISFARNGVAGLWIGNSYFFYITSKGIELANITASDMSYARTINYNKKAGVNTSSEEINLQNTLDTTKRFLIGSGVIDYQRLSGYISSTGEIKLFYYGSGGVLTSMESEDGSKWNFASNF